MGSVWRVRDDGGQEYAMKILRDSLSEDDVPPDSPEARERLTARERLRREAMALRRVQHPGVCGIVDMELDDSLAFIVTELIEGKNLRDDVAANGRYVGTDLERLTRKLIDAVKAVHAAGVGNGDALHVLDDVAGALEFKVLGLAAERLARDRSRVRHGNRLRASQRADELSVQDAAILLVAVGNSGGIDLAGHVCSSTTGLWRPHCSARARL